MKKICILFVAMVALNGVRAQSCLPEGITFYTQADIDNFQINYPGCTEIVGNVSTVWGSDIFNLNGLNAVTSIGGDLFINGNNSLTSLTGLSNLTVIGGTLDIGGNGALTSLTGLEDLTSIGGSLFIYSNSLTSLTGLENLTSIGGSLVIVSNEVLTSLSGLDNIDAGSILGLNVFGNYSLSSCAVQSICEYLTSPNGSVIFADNAPGCNSTPDVANSCDITLPCLPYGPYYFYSQNDIDNFTTNYPGCTVLAGDVLIIGYDITNLNGLSVITSIGGFLEIGGTPALTSLTGLNGLTSIGSWLSIYGTGLTSLVGLENIDAGSITDLTIANNSSLSTCEVKSICDYLASPNGTISIYDNADGCNSQEEVQARCAPPAVVPISNWALILGGSLIALGVYMRYKSIL